MRDKVFKALSDKNRRKILKLLKSNDGLFAGEIADKFNISKPAISKHLNSLKKANLIYSKRMGKYIKYYINMSVFEELISYFINIKGDKKEDL